MKKIIPKDAVLVPDQAQRVFKGQIFDVYQWPQLMFDGSTETFEMLKRTDTVNAFCVIDGKILILDDEQPHTGVRQTLPGGRIDQEDESVLAAAQREIREETGYSFKNWRLIKVVQPHSKIEWFVHTLLAWEVTDKQEPHLDAGEKITVEEISLEDLKSQVLNKARYLDEVKSILADVSSITDLVNSAEFQGQTVDR